MYISEIKNHNNFIAIPFKGKENVVKILTKPTAGKLTFQTSRDLGDILRAYKEIRTRLACITKEGLDYIQKEFPNITIGEGLTFHNCGDFKTSILIRCAESIENSGLSRIIERKGNSTWSERIVINSFLIDGNDKLLKNTDENKQKLYPKTREYLTDEEITRGGLEKTLSDVLKDLDPVMLSFRQYLKSVPIKYQKVPDGIIPYSLLKKLNEIDQDCAEIDVALKNLPAATELSLRKSYPNYKLITGLTTHAFENLGEEKVTLTFRPISSSGFPSLRRLNVFDQNGNVVRTFLVTTEGKMVSNLNQNFTNSLPDKLAFVDSDNMQDEKYLPYFEKYLTMYSKKINGLKSYIINYLTERAKLADSIPLEFPYETQKDFSAITDALGGINKMLSAIPALKGLEIKKNVPDLYAPAGRKGVTFDKFKGCKQVYFLPVKTKLHSGLTKLTITDPKKNTETIYLIKDGKFLVKNFNPKYSQVLPKTLILVKEVDKELDKELLAALAFIREKTENYEEITRKEFNKVLEAKELKRELKTKKALKKDFLKKKSEGFNPSTVSDIDERKKFIAACKDKLSTIKHNLNVAPEEFKNMLEEFKGLIENFGKK